jgi:hypothetical protein
LKAEEEEVKEVDEREEEELEEVAKRDESLPNVETVPSLDGIETCRIGKFGGAVTPGTSRAAKSNSPH